MSGRFPLLSLLVLLSGCGRSPHSSDGTEHESLEVVVDSSTAQPAAIDFAGYGPVRLGMSVQEAERALGDTIDVSAAPPGSSCTYATARHQPGVAFMLIDGSIVRIDAREGAVRTPEGAGIGDSEQRIHDLYGGNVEIQPHKYVDGHYLIVRPPAGSDSTRRLIFETDGQRVTTFRGGRMPEVGWIEGCS